MKRLFFIILLISFSHTMVACTAPNGIDVQIPTTDNMKYMDTETRKIEDEVVTAKNYSISDKSIEELMTEYEQLLNENGWETTYKVEPTFLQVIKNEIELTVLPVEQDTNPIIKVIIRSKTSK